MATLKISLLAVSTVSLLETKAGRGTGEAGRGTGEAGRGRGCERARAENARVWRV